MLKQTTNILQKRLRIFARFSMFALLTVSAQGVWGQTEYLSLWDTGSNSSIISRNLLCFRGIFCTFATTLPIKAKTATFSI